MKGSQTYVPGVGLVPYVPGGRIYRSLRSVEIEDQTIGNPGADTPNRSQRVATDWSGHGLLAVFGALALAAVIDLAVLALTAWLLFR